MWSKFLLAGLAAVASSLAINEPEVRHHMEVLTGPGMEGRLPLTPGNEAAAQYIAGEFRRIGLKPGGTQGYFHEFEVTINQRPSARNIAVFTNAKGERTSLEVGRDYLPVFGTQGDRLVSAPVVYAGFGLNQEGWNDYANLVVRDKVVAVLSGVPAGRSPATNGLKAKWAKEAGARAVIFVGPDRTGGRSLPTTARGQGVAPELGIVAIGMNEAAFARITGLDNAILRGVASPGGQDLPLQARLVTALEPNRGKSNNVVGVLPGRDAKLRNEVIIIGGHFDHLGWGEVGSRTGNELIHHGADDNASGTTGVLALARYFAQAKTNRRTYIFQTYSAEEEGLVGSNAWARDNPEILKRTQAMVNLDMIGRLRDGKLIVFGTGTANELNGILDRTQTPDLVLTRTATAPGNSDHASFVQRGVPALFFHTDLHGEYHTENDALSTINLDGMVQVLAQVRQTIQGIDGLDTRLTFVPQATTPRPGGGRRVRVGFIPEMGDTGEGVLISGAIAGSPAAKAGFRAGDRIMQFGDVPLKTLEDLQRAMAAAKPGTAIKVIFMRGGQRTEAMLTPEAPIQS